MGASRSSSKKGGKKPKRDQEGTKVDLRRDRKGKTLKSSTLAWCEKKRIGGEETAQKKGVPGEKKIVHPPEER